MQFGNALSIQRRYRGIRSLFASLSWDCSGAWGSLLSEDGRGSFLSILVLLVRPHPMLYYFFRNLNCSSLDPLLDNNCRALWSYLLLKFFTGFSRMSMMWLFMPLLLWHNVIWERRNKLVFQRVRLLFDLVFQQADVFGLLLICVTSRDSTHLQPSWSYPTQGVLRSILILLWLFCMWLDLDS